MYIALECIWTPRRYRAQAARDATDFSLKCHRIYGRGSADGIQNQGMSWGNAWSAASSR